MGWALTAGLTQPGVTAATRLKVEPTSRHVALIFGASKPMLSSVSRPFIDNVISKPFSCTIAAVLLIPLATALTANVALAQVALSFGAQEIYDDNIYLEDDNGAFTPETLAAFEALPPDQQALVRPPVNGDGDPDSDFITNLNIGLAGPVALSPHIQMGVDTTFGVLLFGSESDSNRLTLDSTIRIRPDETFLPQPFFVSFASSFSSGAADIAVADGTSARQSQSHSASMDLGVQDILLGEDTIFSSSYQLERRDFLGAFFFNEENDITDGRLPNFDEEGSDFFETSFRLH